jgi:hypothetical protein
MLVVVLVALIVVSFAPDGLDIWWPPAGSRCDDS